MAWLRWLPVALAACAASPDAHGVQACAIRKAAEIPVSFERGFVSAPAVIEDKPVRLLIDTGSEASLVTPSAMSELHLQPDRRRRTTIRGTGGTMTTQNAWLHSIGVGGLEFLGQSTAVGPLPAPNGIAVHAAGLLGADWLSDFDIEMDLPQSRIALYRVEGCGGDDVPWPGRKTTVTAQIYRRGLVIVTARLEGQSVTALLDSGANLSLLSEVAAARIGVDAKSLAGDRLDSSMGVDGATVTTHIHRFGQFRLGEVSYARPLIRVGRLNAVADMLLGADWLRANRVWISYAAHRVTVQPLRQPGQE